jgi:hypothetical protein
MKEICVTDFLSAGFAALDWLEQDQRERYRPQSEPKQEQAPPRVPSIPAIEGSPNLSPLARADLAAAHGMVATITRMQAEGSISTPLLGGDR